MRPGVFDVLATEFPKRELIVLDFPTLDLPIKLNPIISGFSYNHSTSCSGLLIPYLNLVCPLNIS